MVWKLLRCYELPIIKIKFIIIYFLNLSDILFTALLLRSGYFEEGNILLKDVVNSKGLSFGLKIALPLILLTIVFKRMKAANESQLKIGNILINCCMAFYVCINLSHVLWMFYSFNFLFKV